MQCFKIKAEMQDVYSSALFKDIRSYYFLHEVLPVCPRSNLFVV